MKFSKVVNMVNNSRTDFVLQVGFITEEKYLCPVVTLRTARSRNGKYYAVLFASIPEVIDKSNWKFENPDIEFDDCIRIPYTSDVQVTDDMIRWTVMEVPFFKDTGIKDSDEIYTIGMKLAEYYSHVKVLGKKHNCCFVVVR